MTNDKCDRPFGHYVSTDRLDENLRKWNASIALLRIAGATACAEVLATARDDLLELLGLDDSLPF